MTSETITSTRLSRWATDIRKIKDTKLTLEHKDLAFNHLLDVVTFNDVIFYIGLFFSFLDASYMFPWIMMGISISSHWTTVSHHVSHGGYADANHKIYNRFTFGVKQRRWFDWMDYILPEAWHCEHNIYHHYKLNEETDPDNVQRNFDIVRTMNVPLILKYGIIVFFALTWRLLYYSPNSYKYYRASRIKRTLEDDDYNQMTLVGMITNYWPSWVSKTEYLSHVLWPYVLYRAVCFAPCYMAYMYFPDIFTITHIQNVVLNYILADLFCSVHTFITILPNHAGRDMYLYRTPVTAKSDEWLLRQCISSANYTTGNNILDYLQGWLNYQIEHHLFPDLSAYEYQVIHKDVREVCERHGIPYVCENLCIRLGKTVKIMTGQESIPYYEGSELEKYVNERL